MDTARIAHPAPASLDTRELRALALAEERFEEIAASHRGGLYTVPSLHGDIATTSPTPPAKSPAPAPTGRSAAPPCYHVLAAAVVRAKTGVCSGCGRRFRHRELTECVEGSHDNLTYFDGDLLCPGCADNAGVDR